MQGSRVQEYGSEVEDMLSSEISLDRFYSKHIQNISTSDTTNNVWRMQLLILAKLMRLILICRY